MSLRSFTLSELGRRRQLRWHGAAARWLYCVLNDITIHEDGYDAALQAEGRIEAGCLAHPRRTFDELARVNASPVATQAIERIARRYKVEA